MTIVQERSAVGRPTRLSWAFFDWAQQPYYTLIGSFIFRPYFVAAVAVTPAIGQAQIGFTGAIAGLIVAVAGPLLGLLIERGDLRAWLAWTSVPFIVACTALWWALPDGAAPILLILACLTLAAVFAELTTTVNNAMLPPIATPGALGRLSGFGVALGCLGGLAAAMVVLVFFIQPEQPLLGLDKVSHEPERFVGPFSALWYLLFTLPLLLVYPRGVAAPRRANALGELWRLVRELPRNRPMLWFFIGRTLVADATSAVQIFGGIIAAATFGWGPMELGLFGIMVLAAGGAGSLLGGSIDDRFGAKISVLLTGVAVVVALAGIGSVSTDHILFVVPVPLDDGVGFLSSVSERTFVGFSMLLGLATGPLTGSMRTWMAQLSPAGEEGRWFGLYAVAGRATAFAAPLMVSIGTLLTGQIGAAIPVILLFLAAGLVAFWRVPATGRV